jgi:hypothetical protein
VVPALAGLFIKAGLCRAEFVPRVWRAIMTRVGIELKGPDNMAYFEKSWG